MSAPHKSFGVFVAVTAFMILLGSGGFTVAFAQSPEQPSSPRTSAQITWMLSDYPPIGIAEVADHVFNVTHTNPDEAARFIVAKFL